MHRELALDMTHEIALNGLRSAAHRIANRARR
jgi:hypothetical protein